MDLSQTLAIAIALTALSPVVLGVATDTARRIPQADLSALKSPLATAVVCASLLRTAPAMAVTPPPIERLPAVEVGQPTSTDPVSEPTPDRQDHVVAVGDSLWSIACQTLRQRLHREPSSSEVDSYWRTIYATNRQLVGDDPNLIHPGQRLVLP